MAHYADTSAYTDAEKRLWDELIAQEGNTFFTAKGLPFTYRIKGNEIFFSRKEKSVTRATLNRAFRRMTEENITGSKQLAVFGASYLYPLLKKLGTGKKE